MEIIHKIELFVNEEKGVLTGKVKVFDDDKFFQEVTLKQIVSEVERNVCTCNVCFELVGFVKNMNEIMKGGNV